MTTVSVIGVVTVWIFHLAWHLLFRHHPLWHLSLGKQGKECATWAGHSKNVPIPFLFHAIPTLPNLWCNNWSELQSIYMSYDILDLYGYTVYSSQMLEKLGKAACTNMSAPCVEHKSWSSSRTGPSTFILHRLQGWSSICNKRWDSMMYVCMYVYPQKCKMPLKQPSHLRY